MAQYTYDLYNVSPASSLSPSNAEKSTGAANKLFGGYGRQLAMVQLQPFPDFTNKRLVGLSLHCYLTDTQGTGPHQTYMGLITGNFTTSTSFAALYAMCTGAQDAFERSTNTGSDMVDVANCDLVGFSNVPNAATWFDIDLSSREIMSMINANPTAYKGFWLGLGYRGQHTCRIMTNNDNTLYLRMILEDAYTACTPPESVGVSAGSVAPGASVSLSWSGAGSGTNNPVTGYDIYRATSTGGPYSFLSSVSSSAGSGSVVVTAPTSNGNSFFYKVLTKGSVAGYNSGQSSAYATLTCSFSAPSPPSTVTIGGETSAYVAVGASATLAWSGAGAGTNNPVTGYHIYRDGSFYATTTGTSYSVPAHGTAGSSYTYTVYTLGTYSNSGASAGRTIYTYSSPSAPTSINISAGLANAGNLVTLSWVGSGAGSFNDIVGYIIHRATAVDGPYSYLGEVSTTASIGNAQVTAHATEGQTYYYKVFTKGQRSNSAISTAYAALKTNSKPVAPSTFAVGPILREDGVITLTWSGQSDPDGNYAHQEIQYAVKHKGGNYGGWQVLKTAAGSSTTMTPSLADGDSIQFQTRSVDVLGAVSAWKASNEVVQNSNPLAPTTFTASPALREGGAITLSWNGQTDPDNNILHQEIQYAVRSVSGVWSGWQAFKTATGSSTTTTPALADGERARFQTRTVDTLGATSGWKESNEVIQNTNPSAATTFTASPTIYESGNITLSWAGQYDPDNNIDHQEIEYAIKPPGGSYGAWQALKISTGSSTTTVPTLARGAAIKYRGRTVDVLGSASDWKESNEVVRNSAPIIPTILFPGAEKTTYNTQPYVGLAISAEPNGQAQTLYFSVDGGATQNVGAVAAGTKKFQMPTLAAGNRTLRFWLQDSQGAVSGEASVTVTVAANTYARSFTAGTLIWDEGNNVKHAPEILELKSRVNQVRSYYGLSVINLPYEATTGTNTIKNFHTWMPNMSALYQALADTGTISGANVQAREIKERNAPSAALVNQIRTMIGSL